MKFLFAGDVNISSTPPTIGRRLEQTCASADVVCVNLEGAHSFGEPPQKKAGPNISQSREARDFLALCGVNLVCTANNHFLDFGVKAAEETLSYLGVPHVGFRSGPTDWAQVFTDEHGQKIAIVAGSESFEGSVDQLSEEGFLQLRSRAFEELVTGLAESCDFVFVISHCGLEDVPLPLPEWREEYRNLVRCGASLIVGHHPHLVQPVEIYENRMIFYSIGNFSMPSEYAGAKGSGLAVTIETHSNGNLSSLSHTLKQGDELEILDSQPTVHNFPAEERYRSEVLAECLRITKGELLDGISDSVNGIGHLPTLRSLQKVASTFLARRYVRENPEVILSRYRYLEHLFRVESNRWCLEHGLKLMFNSTHQCQ